MQKKEIVLQDNDQQPPKILATLNISGVIEENSLNHRNKVKALKDLILTFVKSNDTFLELMVNKP